MSLLGGGAQTMKTLKQHLQEKPHYNDEVIIQHQINAVKEWLQEQKKQQFTKNTAEQYYTEKFIEKLIEELEQ